MTQLSQGWHSRGYLPHFDGGELAQFITFRLFDSLPKAVLIEWKEDLKLEKSAEAESIMRRRVEAYLDQGHGSCYLKNGEVATMVPKRFVVSRQSEISLSCVGRHAESCASALHADWTQPRANHAFSEIFYVK